MQNIILFDDTEIRGNLLPLTYTRPVGDLRVGIDTLAQKWQRWLPGNYSTDTAQYLRPKYGAPAPFGPGAIRIASHLVPDARLVSAIKALEPGQRLWQGKRLLAECGGAPASDTEYAGTPLAIEWLYDIFRLNDTVLRADFARFSTTQRGAVAPSVTVIGNPDDLFIDPTATVQGCTINVAKGPVYIGPGAEVMEGACLRGPVAVCEGAIIKMGAKIYGATTIGPHCKAGGEISNTIMMAYSNKAHDGYLGNAVIGQWCNLGAGSVASNLKNDYSPIRLWNYPAHRFLRTGLQFCGLMMGDHSKLGVNTMINTATVLGVGVNIHGSGFPRPFVASFTEGSTAAYNDVAMPKFFETAAKVMARRGVELTRADLDILTHIRQYSEDYR